MVPTAEKPTLLLFPFSSPLLKDSIFNYFLHSSLLYWIVLSSYKDALVSLICLRAMTHFLAIFQRKISQNVVYLHFPHFFNSRSLFNSIQFSFDPAFEISLIKVTQLSPVLSNPTEASLFSSYWLLSSI